MANHLRPFKLLPAKPGTCEQYATAHDPAFPHNQQSITYQYWFYGEHGRWPTWADAMAHCEPRLRDDWAAALKKRGIAVDTADGQRTEATNG